MNQQYVKAERDPPGCSGFIQNKFKPQICGNCNKKTIDHATASEEAIKRAILYQQNTDEATEVFPRVYVGGFKFAMDLVSLQSSKITHIVCTAKGIKEFFPTFREHPTHFQYLHLNMIDSEDENLLERLPNAMRFIHEALYIKQGKVYIHCMQGKSRSGAIAIAYLLLIKNISLPQALQLIKEKRPMVDPNYGFMEQLKTFQNSDVFMELRKELGIEL